MTGSVEQTRDILRKVRQVEIRSRKAVDAALVGAYHSVFKGTGMDFAEVREYQPGDDIRSIDWNVSARMDRPFVKIFTEERELTLLLAVDVSGSLQFGSRAESKRELAAELGSVLAYSAARNADKVGLLLFTDRVEKYVPPRKGRQHILRIIREILFFEPARVGTDLETALRFLNRVQRRKCVCFLLTDFLTFSGGPAANAAQERLLAITNQRHDLICVDLHDRREWELPATGWVALEDAETGEVVEIDCGDPRVRAAYGRLNQERRQALGGTLRRSGIDLLRLETGEPYMRALRQFLHQREQRR